MPSIVGASRLAAILTLDIKPFLRNTEIAQKRLERFRAVTQSLASTLGRGLGVAFGLVGLAAVKTASEFNELESQLRAIGGTQNIDSVVEKSLELGRSTKFTATEVITLGLELKKLGFEAGAVNSALDTSVKLSQVFGGTLAKVGTSVAETQRQFRETNGELRAFDEIGDIFAVAFQNSALDVENLSGALKNVGSVANIAGFDLEQTVALLGALANAGQKAERGGTRLKTTMIRLGKELGFSGEEMQVLTSGTLDVGQVFDLLKNRAGVAGAVITEFGFEIELLRARLEDATGALDVMNEGLEDQLFIQTAKVTNAFQDMGRTLGNSLAPIVRGVAGFVERLAKSYANAGDSTKGFIRQLVVMSVLLPVVTAALAALASVGLIAASGGIGALVLGLSTLVSVLISAKINSKLLQGEIDSLRETQESFNKLLQNTGGNLLNASQTVIQKQLSNINDAISRSADVVEQLQKRARKAQGFIDAAAARGVVPDGETQARVSEQLLQANLTLFDLRLAQFQLILAETAKEEELRRIAQERLDLAKKYTLELGLHNKEITAFQENVTKLIPKLAQGLGVFGESINDAEAVADAIAQVLSIEALDVDPENFPTQVILDLLKIPKGKLKDQATLIELFSKELKNLSAQASAGQLPGLANDVDLVAAAFEKALKRIEGAIKLVDALNKRTEANRQADVLGSLGLSDFGEVTSAKLQSAKTLLTSLLETGSNENSERVKELRDEIVDLESTLGGFNLAQKITQVLSAGETAAGNLLRRNFASGIGDVVESDLLGIDVKRLTDEFNVLFAAANPPEGVSPAATLEDVERAYQALVNAIANRDLAKSFEDFTTAMEGFDTRLAEIDFLKEFGGLTRSEEVDQQIDILTDKVRALRVEATKTQRGQTALDQAEEELRDLIAVSNDLTAGAGLLSFFEQQLSFLGEAFLQASNSGENFFDVLRESFLQTFKALVAKLITLIALFLILRAVAGGVDPGVGGFKGAAAGALGDGNLGSFLGTNLLNLNPRSLATGGSGGGAGQPNLRVVGSISGNNIVISNQRGTRAIDRTFG